MNRFDPRLSFSNLKEGKWDNPLSSATSTELWVPRLGLLNGLSEFLTIVSEDEADKYKGYVWKKSSPEANSRAESTESTLCVYISCHCKFAIVSYSRFADEVFNGNSNPIIMKREFYQEFFCFFDLTWYPFDRQVCFMNFTVQGQTSKSLILRADDGKVNYLGEEYLVEYRVEKIELEVPR